MDFWVGYAFGFATPIVGTLAVIGIGFMWAFKDGIWR